MKLYLKIFGLAVILMCCLSPLVAVDFNDGNLNGIIEDNVNNMDGIDAINNTQIEKNEINEVAQDDEDNATFNVYVDNCSYGDDVRVHIDSDYKHPMNVSFVLYNAAGYPIYNAHNIEISPDGSAVIPANILFYHGEYKLKTIFECKNYTVERTVTFYVN